MITGDFKHLCCFIESIWHVVSLSPSGWSVMINSKYLSLGKHFISIVMYLFWHLFNEFHRFWLIQTGGVTGEDMQSSTKLTLQ